ncbi:MAG TPA: BON domain-containing protein [Burkholderiaceae bacterium]
MRPRVFPALLLTAALAAPALAQERRNWFDDPFLQVTSGLADCPVPLGPLMTAEEMRREQHDRTQRGTSCWLDGRCRLPNAYLYDKEIAPRVKQAVDADGRFGATTSVWIVAQRRQVFLQGCVQRREQADALAAVVRRIDDVEGVVDETMVGTQGTAPYRLRDGVAK